MTVAAPTRESPALEDVRLGLLLPTRLGVAEQKSVQEIVELALIAERAGVHSVWVGDSLFARPRLDPLATLCALATTTTHCILGTAVLVAPMWNPLLLARMVATLDQLAHGRLVLGFGAGPSHGAARKEFAALGIPFHGRLSRTAEILQICRSLWSEGESSVSQHGGSVRGISMLPKPTLALGPKVLLGGRGPRTLAIAGTHFDGWMPVVTSVEDLHAGLQQVRAAATDSDRPDPTVIAYLSVSVDDDQERARATARTSLEEYYGAPWSAISGMQDCAAGTAVDVAATIRRYIAAGANEIILRFCGANVAEQLSVLTTCLR
jgi:alkanesulfonate monooxygenase SsuD/methylene tetrahydromethanopterin reductase-like flavin-dependent oxidoreductase (luciferase family)